MAKKQMIEWSVEDVKKFLKSNKKYGLNVYITYIHLYKIDGTKLLALTENDYKEYNAYPEALFRTLLEKIKKEKDSKDKKGRTLFRKTKESTDSGLDDSPSSETGYITAINGRRDIDIGSGSSSANTSGTASFGINSGGSIHQHTVSQVPPVQDSDYVPASDFNTNPGAVEDPEGLYMVVEDDVNVSANPKPPDRPLPVPDTMPKYPPQRPTNHGMLPPNNYPVNPPINYPPQTTNYPVNPPINYPPQTTNYPVNPPNNYPVNPPNNYPPTSDPQDGYLPFNPRAAPEDIYMNAEDEEFDDEPGGIYMNNAPDEDSALDFPPEEYPTPDDIYMNVPDSSEEDTSEDESETEESIEQLKMRDNGIAEMGRQLSILLAQKKKDSVTSPPVASPPIASRPVPPTKPKLALDNHSPTQPLTMVQKMKLQLEAGNQEASSPQTVAASKKWSVSKPDPPKSSACSTIPESRQWPPSKPETPTLPAKQTAAPPVKPLPATPAKQTPAPPVKPLPATPAKQTPAPPVKQLPAPPSFNKPAPSRNDKPNPPPIDSLPQQISLTCRDDRQEQHRPSARFQSQSQSNTYDDVQIQPLPQQPPQQQPLPKQPLPSYQPQPVHDVVEHPVVDDLIYSDNDLFESFPGYLPNVTRQQAEAILRDHNSPHCYLVRDGSRSKEQFPYILSVKVPGLNVQHMRIGLRSNYRYSIGAEKVGEVQYNSLQALISAHSSSPILVGGINVILSNPIDNIPNLFN